MGHRLTYLYRHRTQRLELLADLVPLHVQITPILLRRYHGQTEDYDGILCHISMRWLIFVLPGCHRYHSDRTVVQSQIGRTDGAIHPDRH